MIRTAIIGAGFVAELHATAYSAIEGVQLCSICDSDAARAQSIAGQYGCRAYTGAYELLEKERPQIVSICLPTFLHKQYTLLALSYGAHVLCEKPLALEISDCEEMANAAKAADKLLMAGQVLRWWGEYHIIAEKIADGTLGTLRHIHAGRLQHASRGGWLLDPAKSGGALFDFHVHDVDYIISLLGVGIRMLTAAGQQTKEGLWRQMDSMLIFENDITVHLEACNSMPQGYPFTAFFRADGTEGTLEYNFTAPINIDRNAKTTSSLKLYQEGKEQDLSFITKGENAQLAAFRDEIAAFVKAVTENSKNAPIPISDSLQVMRLIHLIKCCLETGKTFVDVTKILS
jgi:predicted dehydrogenase